MPADARRASLPADQQMTIEEFLAFTESRPSGERWELIEGQAIMNPSPTNWHQVITGNIYASLAALKVAQSSSWTPLLGIGTIVPGSPRSLPQPDVMVLEHGLGDVPSATSDDAVVLFEVLSRSNTKADQAWRRSAYASIPNCQHYLTVRQQIVHVTRFDRSSKWKAQDIKGLTSALELPDLGDGVIIPLSDIYKFTPIGSA